MSLMMMMMMMMTNCFCGMVDRRKAFSLISSRDHCQRSSPSRISDTPRAVSKPTQNVSSGLVEWSFAVVITTTPRKKRFFSKDLFLRYFLVFALLTFKNLFKEQDVSHLWESEEKVNQLLKIDGRSKLIDMLIKKQFLIMILSCNLTISCL